MDYEVGQLIDYKFRRTGGVFSGTIQYIDEEKIKISSPPAGTSEGEVVKRKRKQSKRGSWYWLEELEILSD